MQKELNLGNRWVAQTDRRLGWGRVTQTDWNLGCCWVVHADRNLV
jgi:hypothetical protein